MGDRAALQAVKQWKFIPAKLRGKPVQAAYNVTVNVDFTNDKAGK
jgi:TonB family protein